MKRSIDRLRNQRITGAAIVRGMAIYSVLLLGVIGTAVLSNPETPARERAVLGMGLSLCVVWCVVGGAVQLALRDRVRERVRRIPLPWQAKFVLFCTALACLEEAVTVSLTNLAPLFGSRVGEAYITASTNYLDTILGHSVVVFVPAYVTWAWILARRRFHPTTVFLLYGVSGSIGEAMFAGNPGHLAAGFWIFVYGLMIYLPACSIPDDRNARPARWYHGLATFVLPMPLTLPVVLLVNRLHPTQPTHFEALPAKQIKAPPRGQR